MVFLEINLTTKQALILFPSLALLGILDGPNGGRLDRELILYLLLAARMVLLRKVKYLEELNKDLWCSQIRSIVIAEKLRYSRRWTNKYLLNYGIKTFGT